MGATQSIDSLHAAIERGDTKLVRRKLRKTSARQLNRPGPDGRTPLEIATAGRHKEIIELLVDQGALRCKANATDQRDRFAGTFYDLVADFESQEFEWEFGKKKAVNWADAIDRGCAKNRGVRKAVEKIRDCLFYDIPWAENTADLVPVDYYHHGQSFLNTNDQLTLAIRYLQEAAIEDDPIFLLKAYTVDSSFFWLVNRYMCKGNAHQVVKKFREDWVGYYVGVILNHPGLRRLRFPGGYTYRGIAMPPENLKKYEVGMALAIKAFQSSSRNPSVTRNFMRDHERKAENSEKKVPVVFIYRLIDETAGLMLKEISEFRDEAEILILPGTLFYVVEVNQTKLPYQIKLEQHSFHTPSDIPTPEMTDSEAEEDEEESIDESKKRRNQIRQQVDEVSDDSKDR